MSELSAAFSQRFGQNPTLFRAPGRINLIGEHIDYHDGLVMPAAIHFQINFAVAPVAEGGTAGTLVAADLNEEVPYDLTQLAPGDVAWANYLLGVMAQLKQAGAEFPAVNVAFGGDIPPGAGLSSSAALECGLALALNDLFGLGLDRMQLALLSQRAEQTFAGVQCGLMDQFASLFGKTGQVVRLDCRSHEYAYFPFPSDGWCLVLMDTQVKHALSDGGYNQRHEESMAGLRAIQARYPNVKSLREVSDAQLTSCQTEMSEVSHRRCRYVLDEIRRVVEAGKALQAGNLAHLGELMYATHHGLQHDYEVSCPELDYLVQVSRDLDAVVGARMMGGGFGGCTLNLVPLGQEEAVGKQLSAAFEAEFGHSPGVYLTQISAGASRA